MMKQLFKHGYQAIILTLLLVSCKKEKTAEPEVAETVISGRSASEISNVFKGPNVAIGGGHARSWIRINHLNAPLELGIELTESAFADLPHDRAALVLLLHHKALEVTPFKHIYFTYNSHGHPPIGVFSVPHFDAHFFLTSNEERLAIPQVTPATLPFFNHAPPVGYMPLTYFPTAPEPQMGLHWSPPPPTFMPFSKVMIYGSYKGKLTFIEPMVTVAHMSVGSSNNYLQPAKFAVAGNYPTKFNIYKDAQSGNYNITLSNFVARTAN